MKIIKKFILQAAASIINNNNNTNIVNQNINYITNNYLTENSIPASIEDIKTQIMPFIKSQIKENAKEIYINSNELKDVNEKILLTHFNNKNYPNNRNMFYKKVSDDFYAIIEHPKSLDFKNMKVEKVDFNEFIFPIIKNILEPCYTIILNATSKLSENCTEWRKKMIAEDKHTIMRVAMNRIDKTIDSLENQAKHLLNEENTLA